MKFRGNTDYFFDYSINIPKRTIYMGPQTDEEMAEFFLKAMDLLSHSTADINIIMNNEGGDEYHGLAIYDSILTSESHITITVYGCAMSMGSWILQAADERVLAPNATVMLHDGSWRLDADFKQARAQMDEAERLNVLMEDTYLAKMQEKDPRMTRTKLRKLLAVDLFLPAEEAVKLGLADRVLEER